MNISFSIDLSSLSDRPARRWDELTNAVEWADQVLKKGSMKIEISSDRNKIAFPVLEDISNVTKFIFTLSWLSKLHALAKYFSFDLFIPKDFELTDDDWNDVEMFYRILSGDACSIRDMKFEFETENQIDLNAIHDIKLTTNLSLCLADQTMGSVPIEINLSRYRILKKENVGSYGIEAMDDGIATISYFDGEPTGTMKRQ